MCGIAGVISYYPAEHCKHGLQQMADALQHRGPVGAGCWTNSEFTVGFSHRRLAILNLTNAAAQPLHYMHYTLVYNGEIYNYKELKEELQYQGYSFLSSGDTEVIPAAFDFWGMDFLHHLDGMFAFALYNDRTKITILARDRFGEKPLYYTHQSSILPTASDNNFYNKKNNNGLVFASEMKALWAAGVERRVNNSMLLNYIAIGYVQNPADKTETFFDNIYSLPPAHVMQISVNERKTTILRWYDATTKINSHPANYDDEKSITDQFSALLSTSVGRRLRSDVSVGTSLSGGLDSSAIVSTMVDCIIKGSQSKTLKGSDFASTFSAVFPGFEKDESAYAKQVARHFDLKQYLVNPTAADLAKNWQRIMYHQEEPVQSSSVFTQYMVYAKAKEKGVTVLLDGQGADEILGGYKKYSHWYLQQLLRSGPGDFIIEKRLLKKNQLIEGWAYRNYAAAFFPAFTARHLSNKANARVTGHAHINPEYVAAYVNNRSLQKPVITSLESILYYNTFVFGLEELLRYADRNSMAHSREVRLPFLNHELVEFVFSLPSDYKIRNGFTKWILRQSMDTQLPKNIVWRTDKVGYEPPQKEWLQQSAIREIIMESRKVLAGKNILQPAVLDAPIIAMNAHDEGNSDWRYMNAASILA